MEQEWATAIIVQLIKLVEFMVIFVFKWRSISHSNVYVLINTQSVSKSKQ